MTQTHLDYLFQVTAAGATRIPGAGPRSGEPTPAFGDHLNRSSSAAQDQASRSGHQEIRQEKPTASAPASPDASPAPRQESSSGGAEGHVKNRDHGTAPNKEPPRADESANVDPETDAPPTESSAENDQNSNDREDPSISPNGAEPAAATAVIASATDTLLAAAESDQPTAHHSTAAAIVASAETASEESHDSASTERVKLAVDESGLEEVPGERASASQSSRATDTEMSATPSTNGKLKGKAALDERPRGESEQRNLHKTPQRVPGGDRAPDVTATAAGDAEPRPVAHELTAPDPADGTNASADEPRRRAAPQAASRVEANATVPNAAVGPVADKTAPQAPESSAPSADAAEGATRLTGKAAAARNEALANILGRPHAGASAVNRGARPAGEDELPRVDPARFIGRVAKAFHTAHERGGTLQLRLSPPELGSLRLELTVKDGVMIAALETETHAARRVLLDHLPALRERLAEQNIRVERFDVDVRREGGGSQGDDRAPQQQRHDQRPDQPPPRRQPATTPLSGGTAEAHSVPIGTNNTQINLVA